MLDISRLTICVGVGGAGVALPLFGVGLCCKRWAICVSRFCPGLPEPSHFEAQPCAPNDWLKPAAVALRSKIVSSTTMSRAFLRVNGLLCGPSGLTGASAGIGVVGI